MIFAILLIVGLGFTAELFLPWWSVAVVALAVGFWRSKSGGHAFKAGFLGVAILWLVASAYIHFESGGILTARIAEMVHLPTAWLLLLVTMLVGGWIGGLATWTGFHLRATVKRSSLRR